MRDDDTPSIERPSTENPLWQLRGIAKKLFDELGGGENFIRQERLQFDTSLRDTDSEPA